MLFNNRRIARKISKYERNSLTLKIKRNEKRMSEVNKKNCEEIYTDLKSENERLHLFLKENNINL